MYFQATYQNDYEPFGGKVDIVIKFFSMNNAIEFDLTMFSKSFSLIWVFMLKNI